MTAKTAKRPDFGVMILTHGRAGRVVTDKTLRKHGYTGPIHYVVDDEDDQLDQYLLDYGDEQVHVFSKDDEATRTDIMDLDPARNVVVYARNASQRIAKKIGWKFMWMLDDDYTSFEYRYPKGRKLMVEKVRDLDTVLAIMLRFLRQSGALTVAMGQGGDLIGGMNRNMRIGLLRKAMNSFLLDTSRPLEFMGRINEDTNAYVTHGNRGDLIFTIMDVCLVQKQTQQNAGGLTDSYLASGTYVKSFYTVMRNPSSVTVAMLQANHTRMHHSVNWRRTTPMIIAEHWKKPTEEQ